ncbi:MAG: hypothetical protein B7Y73_09770 [Acidocella sp. 35-58-6]|nr:MAG: hypothetical protein B7Y73_09770 [Acidocella sp. 35-58-6]
MITIRRQLLGLGFVAASSLLALNAAQAMSGPTAIQIDGGPLGALQLSGGVDGYGYYYNPSLSGSSSNGANVANGLIELQKTDGVLQFTVEIGSNGGAIGLGAGTKPAQTSITTFTTGPLYAGYVTIAPTGLPITISAGQLGSLEGYESGIDWNNPSQLTTDIFQVQNSQNRGVNINYTSGPISATLQFGDGWDTGVFNFLQGLATYTIDSSNAMNVYFAANLGTTGNNTFAYGGSTGGSYGPYYANSDMIGGFYSYTNGNLNLVPEVQYVYAKANNKLGLTKSSANFGAALFGTYTFGTSPYSVGGWVEYEKSTGLDNWFAGANSELAGFSVAPTWQYKDLFARANMGVSYLLNNKYDGMSYGYGNKNNGKIALVGTLEAGVLF